MMDYETTAAFLVDGGWTVKDATQIAETYELSKEATEKIISEMEKIIF